MTAKSEQKNGFIIIISEDVTIKEAFFISLPKTWYVIMDSKPEGKQSVREVAETKLNLLDNKKIRILPPKWEIGNPYYYTGSPDNVRVAIFGMDPYVQPGYAMGLAFSMRRGIKISQSLNNIFSVLNKFSGYEFPKNNTNGSLVKWALQGVMLMNVGLTIEEGAKSGAHITMWCSYTELFIKALTLYKKGLILVFWGKDAQEYQKYVKQPQEHHILVGVHPAAHGGEFLSQFEEDPKDEKKKSHFIRINEILEKRGESPIDWSNY